MKLMISLSHPYITDFNTLKAVMPYIIEAKLEYGMVNPESLRVALLDHGVKMEDVDDLIAKAMTVMKKDPQLVS